MQDVLEISFNFNERTIRKRPKVEQMVLDDIQKHYAATAKVIEHLDKFLREISKVPPG